MEYYLLYYEWGYVEEAGDLFPKLIYCVSVGDLLPSQLWSIAVEKEINYAVSPDHWQEFHGFSPDEGYEPYYELRTVDYISEPFIIARVAESIKGFKKVSTDVDNIRNEVIGFMREIVDMAGVVRTITSAAEPSSDTISASQKGNLSETKQQSVKQIHQGKYEEFVETLIKQSVDDGTEGKSGKLITVKEIVSHFLKMPDFSGKDAPKPESIAKAVMRTLAWKNRKLIQQQVRIEKMRSEQYVNRKKNDKRQNGISLEPYIDVNSDGDSREDFD